MKRDFYLRALATAGAAWGLAATISAAPLTVTWGAQAEGGALATSAGQELPSGCLIRLGYFGHSLTHVQESAWDVASLDSHFTELARATTGEFGGTQLDVAGTFAQMIAADSTTLPPLLVNRTLCVWACNAPALQTATEIGIFTSSTWQMSVGQVGGIVWDLSQIEAEGLIVGSFSPTQSPTLGGQMNQLTSVNALRDASDSDSDGAAFLLEEAFGMDPGLPDAVLMPEVVILGDTFPPLSGYRFRRPAGGLVLNGAIYDAAGFRYTVEVSDDLKNWRVDPASCQVHELRPIGDGYEIVTLRPSPTTADRPDFFRLKVERQ